MALTTLDPKTALILVDLQKGIVALPTAHSAADVVHHHSGAAAGQVQCVESPESAAGSRDHRHLAGEVNHELLLTQYGRRPSSLTSVKPDPTVEQIFGQQAPEVWRSRVADDAPGERLQALGMFASALAGRPVAVAELQPGEPPWTDGQTIYVEVPARASAKLKALEAIAVQASMIAAGSLEPDVVRPLIRHPRLARRYLTLEGHRALVANAGLLPGFLVAAGDREIASRSDSAAASLNIAAGRLDLDDPAPGFGVIRAAKVLAACSRAAEQQDQAKPKHVPRGGGAQQEELQELDDGEIDDSDDPDLFTSPVGGGGFIGKWLNKMLSSARKTGSGGGPPGADNPTHRTHSGRRGPHAVSSLASASSEDVDDRAAQSDGATYPEWDVTRRSYRPGWCAPCAR